MASKKILCPYCFEEFDNTQAWYQCESEERDGDGEYRCKRVTSEEYDKYWGDENNDTPIRNVWEQKGGLKARLFGSKFNEQKCPQCGYRSRRFVCPHCFNWLPTHMIENGAEIISVIGSPSSGKTNYIVSLIHQLRKYGYKLDLQVTPTQIYRDQHKEESTQNIFKKLDTQLFTDKIMLKKTKIDKTDIPWIFHLQQGKSKKEIYLVFYDSAGEKFDTVNEMKKQAKYLKESCGVIVMLDVMSIPYVYNTLKKIGVENIVGNVETKDFENIFTSIENFRTNEASDLVKKPFAFVFSKFDAIIDYKKELGINTNEFVVGDKKIDSSYIKTGVVDLQKINDISATIEMTLSPTNGNQNYDPDDDDDEDDELRSNGWGCGSQVGIVHNWGKITGNDCNPEDPDNNYKFFGVSAFGSMPNENNELEKIKPYRVMDPLIWILHKLGHFDIPTKK